MSIAFQIPSNRKILVQRLKNIYFGLKNLLSEPIENLHSFIDKTLD